MANCRIQGRHPEVSLTEVIKRLPHNATAEQAAELTPAHFAAALRLPFCGPCRVRIRVEPPIPGQSAVGGLDPGLPPGIPPGWIKIRA